MSEENRNIVTNYVEVSFSGVKLDSETPGVSESLWTTTFVYDSRKPDNHRGLNARRPQEICTGQIVDIVGHLEKTLCRRPSRVYDPLRNSFSVKRCKLLDQMVIFKQNRTCTMV